MSEEPSPTSPHRRSLRRLAAIAARWGILLVAVVAVFWISGCMERLFYYPQSGPTPPPTGRFPGTESVRFASADGTMLHGWFIPARPWRDAASPHDSRRRPTILHVHGNAGNIDSHLFFTECLPSRGFNLFIFDYRGYGESDGAARRRDDLIADTHAALDALLTREDVDGRAIGLYAQSLGGAIGISVMADRQEIAAAVVCSAFSSWREMAASALGGGSPGPVARLLAAICIKDHRRPDEAIAAIDRPILLLHGDGDRTIPVEHGRRLARAGGASVTYVELPGGDHNDLRTTHPAIDDLTTEFFRRHLGAEEPAAEPTESSEEPAPP